MSGAPTVLTIHASDTAGEEGILADAATLRDLGCRPVQVTTALLLTRRGAGTVVEALPLPLVAEQFEAAIAEAPPAAVRVGVLADPLQVETVATLLRESGAREVVVAPVLRAGGSKVLDDATIEAAKRELFPLARVVIVRASDLAALTGERAGGLAELERGAREILGQGARAAVVSGGGWGERVVDLLLDDGGSVTVFDARRIAAPRVAGVAGAHPAAVAAFLARGETLARAADAAQRHVGVRLDRAAE